ncbi:MAG: FCD domain-containing protein [Thermodesulfobacteriota bacterium]
MNPDLLSKMEDNILEVKELYEANEIIEYPFIGFHILIALATENPMFAIVIRTLRAAFSLAKHPRNRYQLETIQYHQNILEAIKSRDPVAARELM